MSAKVFAVPPGADFANVFATGFRLRFGSASEEAARAQVLVNTRRSRTALEDALAETVDGAAYLPRIEVLSELHADPLAAPELPVAIDPVRRLLRMTRLVEQYLTASRDEDEVGVPLAAATDLARSLIGLLDEMQDEGVDPASLDDLVSGSLPAESARHWQRTVQFVDIIRRAWPSIRAEEEAGALDPKERQCAVIASLSRSWGSEPPPGSVIAAASTGSVGSTADLLAAIARLPDGMVVLPGFDPDVAPDIWESAGPEHPMAPFRGVLTRLGLEPRDVAFWVADMLTARRRLFAQALRPAPVTDHWQEAVVALAGEVTEATEGLTLVEAETPRQEADAIAVAIREALEVPRRSVALVTPDAALARRITAALAACAIVPDDSLGQPLAQTPPGVLFRLIADVAAGEDVIPLAALLTHPLVSAGHDRTQHLQFARRYVNEALRASPDPKRALRSWPGGEQSEHAWLSGVAAALAPLEVAISAGSDLSVLLAAHIDAAEALTMPPGGEPEIWKTGAGEALYSFLSRLALSQDAYDAEPPDYRALLGSLLDGEQVRPDPTLPHPRVSIWGTREARVLHADLTILGGLNEGVWPAVPEPDPWLSRPMREALGMPAPERRIGLAAHDFLQGVTKPEVVLTRSLKSEGAPTVASRWLIRLEHLLGGMPDTDGLQAMRFRGRRLLDLARARSAPISSEPRASRPCPTPAVSARPRRLSATDIEMLVRDAYAIYARHILDLKPLDPLGRAPDYRERGTIMHRVLEDFLNATRSDWPGAEAAREAFDRVTERVLTSEVPWHDLRRIWGARIGRFATWFLEGEALRRTAGVPFAPELKGEMVLQLPAGPMTVVAKADRIDLLHDGTAAIYDYKTGTPPSVAQIKAGFNQQIHIQAAILAEDGFPGVVNRSASWGGYLGLTGGGAGGIERPVPDLAKELPDYLAKLRRFLSGFDSEARGYLARGRIERADSIGDYDHLSRRDEWEGEDAG